MVLGENGLFNKAKSSVGKYENAQERENGVLAGYETEINSYINGNRDYEEEINALKSRIDELESRTDELESNKVVLYSQQYAGYSITKKYTLAKSYSDGGTIYTISEYPNQFKKIEITVGVETGNGTNNNFWYPTGGVYTWDLANGGLYLRNSVVINSSSMGSFQIDGTTNSKEIKIWDAGHTGEVNGVFILSVIGYK